MVLLCVCADVPVVRRRWSERQEHCCSDSPIYIYKLLPLSFIHGRLMMFFLLAPANPSFLYRPLDLLTLAPKHQFVWSINQQDQSPRRRRRNPPLFITGFLLNVIYQHSQLISSSWQVLGPQKGDTSAMLSAVILVGKFLSFFKKNILNLIFGTDCHRLPDIGCGSNEEIVWRYNFPRV